MLRPMVMEHRILPHGLTMRMVIAKQKPQLTQTEERKSISIMKTGKLFTQKKSIPTTFQPVYTRLLM